MKYLIAIDQGTTSSRAILIDKNGKLVDIKQKEFTQIFPKQGWVEHDPSEILSSQYEVFEELLLSNNITPKKYYKYRYYKSKRDYCFMGKRYWETTL